MQTTMLIILMNLLLFFILWFFLFNQYFIDLFRQKLIELRYELFDFVNENGIGFDEPAFKDLYKEINGLIKFAHDAKPLILCVIFFKKPDKAHLYKAKVDENLQNLTYWNREKIVEFRTKQFNIFTDYIIKSTLLLLILHTIYMFFKKILLHFGSFTIYFQRKKSFQSLLIPIAETYTYATVKVAKE